MFQSFRTLSHKLCGEYESGKSAGYSSVLGVSFRMRLLLEIERKEWKIGANGNDNFLNKLIIQGAYIAHSYVKFLDSPRLCKSEGKLLCGSNDASMSHFVR